MLAQIIVVPSMLQRTSCATLGGSAKAVSIVRPSPVVSIAAGSKGLVPGCIFLEGERGSLFHMHAAVHLPHRLSMEESHAVGVRVGYLHNDVGSPSQPSVGPIESRDTKARSRFPPDLERAASVSL